MRKAILFLSLFGLLLPSVMYGQRINKVLIVNPGGATVDIPLRLTAVGRTNLNTGPYASGAGTGNAYHSLAWTATGGTYTTCSIKLEQSTDNSTWSDLITTQDCSTAGQTSVWIAETTYLAVSFETRTVATGNPVLNLSYLGYSSNPMQSTSATISTSGLATSNNQTSGAHKTQIVDGSGNVIGATSNAMDVNVKNITTDTAVGSTPTENPVGLGGVYTATQSAVATTQRTAIQTDAYGNALVVPKSGVSYGATPYTHTSTNTANLTAITDGPTTVYGGVITNINAAVMYVKFYNKATAPDPSACSTNSDCPVLVFAIPGSTTVGGMILPIPVGVDFSTGLGMSITTGIASTDETAVAANEVIVNLWYKH